MPFGFVLANPGRRTRRRKARRRFGGRARASRLGWRRRRHSKRARSANPHRRRRGGKRRHARRRRNFSASVPFILPNRGRHRRKSRSGRRSHRRRRNPGGASLGGMSLALPKIVPINVPLPGIFGTLANNVVQGAGYGAAFLTGYMASDWLVSMMIPAQGKANAPDPNTFTGKYGRILAFGAMSGLTGYAVAKIGKALKLQHPGIIAAIAAAGPAVRAFGGILRLAFADSATDSFGGWLRDKGGALADFLQLSDFIQTGSELSGPGDETFGLGDPSDETMSLGERSDDMVEAGIDSASDEDMEAVY